MSDVIKKANFHLTIIKGGKGCLHRSVSVDKNSREVQCNGCHVSLDAFNVLLSFAEMERSLDYSRKEVIECRELVEALKKEARNLKQKIARAKKKDQLNL